MSEARTLTNPSQYTAFERPGIYRRRIRIQTARGEARADLEDDPHRYGVIVHHDGKRVKSVEGLALRTPYDLCADAAGMLDRLVSMALSPHPLAVYRFTNGRAQCTHMLDLAGLAIAHAARGTALRQYDVEVPCLNPLGRQTVRLCRDGVPALEWKIERSHIVAPLPYSGHNLRSMMPWVESTFTNLDDLEAIVVLRRGIYISGSRAYDLDTLPVAASTGHVSGACYVFQPKMAARAVRIIGSTRDFSNVSERLLADLKGK